MAAGGAQTASGKTALSQHHQIVGAQVMGSQGSRPSQCSFLQHPWEREPRLGETKTSVGVQPGFVQQFGAPSPVWEKVGALPRSGMGSNGCEGPRHYGMSQPLILR